MGGVSFLSTSQWVGNVDNDWFNPGNWSSGVPDEYTDVIIPYVNPNPYPFVNGDASCFILNIASGASLNIKPDGSLRAKGDLINNGQFTIESTPDGDGSFIDNGTITGSGTYTVERYLQEESWHYISSPIADALSGAFLNIYLKEFNEEDSVWSYIVSVNVPLIPMKGYAAWASNNLTGNKTVFFNGTLNTGTLGVDLTNHGGAAHHSKGFNFVGNPYPSAVNWEQDDGWARSNIDNAIYLWNPNAGQYGSYILGNPNSGTNGIDSIIPSCQGFFVHVTSGFETGSLTVNNNARIHSSKSFLKNTMADQQGQFLKLKISGSSNSYTDETIIRFSENASENYDPQYDAFKFNGLFEAPQLYSVSGDSVNLAVNTFPTLTKNRIIPLNLAVGIDEMYTIEATDILNFSPTTKIILEDKKENLFTDLTSQINYSFYAGTLNDPARFTIHFLADPSGISTTSAAQDLLIFSQGHEVFLQRLEAGFLSGELIVYDMMGKAICQKQINNTNRYSLVLQNRGVYCVTYTDRVEHRIFKQKILIK